MNKPNRINQLFLRKPRNIMNIFFTAGFPKLEDTKTIALALEKEGADLLEIGIPYSDPLADGPTIQASGQQALQNGMTVKLLFEQVVDIRRHSEIPIVLMGNFNQVMQYGENQFFRKCAEVGVDGLILPDMPVYLYEQEFKSLFEELGLGITFLVAPQTSDERLKEIDGLTRGFVYVVSSAAITGGTGGISDAQETYFKRITSFGWNHPTLIGFGIKDESTFAKACAYANGAIIGSAFIRALEKGKDDLEGAVHDFVNGIKIKK